MGRVLTWADPKIIEMARTNFVAVAADDWYQRRRQDDEGEFFRKVSDQGPRKDAGTNTRQGIYVFSAGGILLGFKNHRDPDVMRQFLIDSLKNWQKLPDRERLPRAVEVGEISKLDPVYHRELPKGGAVVNVYTRILDRTAAGEVCPGTCSFPGGDRSAHDHLWLLPDEVHALIPARPITGARIDLPERLTMRLGRFHLVDNTRGEPPFWSQSQVHEGKLQAVVDKLEGDKVTLKLEGSYILTTQSAAKSDRGFEAKLFGFITVNTVKKSLERFDLVAFGDHWGQGPYTGGARPGPAPLGVAFALSRGDAAADRVPPQAAREWQRYVQAER